MDIKKEKSDYFFDVLMKLKFDLGFETANEIGTLFGDVVLPDKIHMFSELDKDIVFEIFYKDTQEIIYKTDNAGKVEGIVTFGSFLLNYAQGKPWVNTDFSFVTKENINKDKIQDIFEKSEKILRIPVLDKEGKLCFEIRRYSETNGQEDRRKQLIPFAKLRNRNIPCFFVRRPDFLEGYVYTSEEQYRIENRLSFTKMQADIDKYEKELKRIIGQDYSREYVEKLSQIPPIIMEGKRYRHADTSTEFINVIGGQRVTIGAPEIYDRCIHVYGQCGAFGYAVEDIQTIPSQLQKFCNQDGRNIRVENHGTWGTDAFLDNLLLDIEEGFIQENDIVLVYAMLDAWWHRDEIERISVDCYDTTEEFHGLLKRGNTFYEMPGHMTAEGYAFVASLIYERMKEKKVFDNVIQKKHMSHTVDSSFESGTVKEIEDYLEKIKTLLPVEQLFQVKTGAIVMNCNPFTLGHRYLVESAMNFVDDLLLFIVEENKSFFSFEDRIEMVRQGTRDIANVYVVPSGNYIISALTFPGYFLKEQSPDMKVDVADDVKIFGKYIAPALHITDRFVGTEPLDKVTAQYHVFLKRYLGDYGIKLHEIPRQQIGEEYISARIVRKMLAEKNYEQLRQYVPDTTFEYLTNTFKS